MDDQWERLRMLLGDEALCRLQNSRVALFGLGGVGGYALEALLRSGIGHLLLVDNDSFSPSNLNRQLLATRASLGQSKLQAAAERAALINPACEIRLQQLFFLPENAPDFDFPGVDYIIDAMDTVSAKLALIQRARDLNIPLISCLGTGNKLDPTALKLGDIYTTSVCPLARVMRRECKKRGIASLKVVYSTEKPLSPLSQASEKRPEAGRRDVPGSAAFVPGAAGLILAAEAVRDLLKIHKKQGSTE